MMSVALLQDTLQESKQSHAFNKKTEKMAKNPKFQQSLS
jgi:hypothetical protein